MGVDASGAKFAIAIEQDPADARILHVTSTGTCRGASRTASMEFRIDKKVKYAIVGKVPIQVGRNTMIDGPVAMTTAGKYPPIYTLSDFRHLTPALAGRIDAFNAFLKSSHAGYDNRVTVKNETEWDAAQRAGYPTANEDGWIDEYDLSSRRSRRRGHGRHPVPSSPPVHRRLYDADLFDAINAMGKAQGFDDDRIDNRDGYAKVKGQVCVATTAGAWQSRATIQDQLRGPVAPPDGASPAVKFAVTDPFDLSPFNFDTSGFRTMTGPENVASVTSGAVIENAVLTTAMANGGTADERTPYGSTSYQATYRRPVFRNKTFRNCRIPKGLNALFDNCRFEGVTFVELETNITTSTGATTTSQTEAMKWSQRMKSGSFSKSTALTSTNSWGYVRGNNLRFNDCVVEGPLMSERADGVLPLHQLLGVHRGTYFENKSAIDTATMICPQTNIEMGSFTEPGHAPSTLIGVVVAGNLDIRGTSVVDGSVIITGDGAGNTTQGWFGASDSSTDPSSPMPEGGWGKLNIRYNPDRALPDGINIQIDILPDRDSYSEEL